MTAVNLLMRWLHIFSVIAAVGATVFLRLVLIPSMAEIQDEARAQLMKSLAGRLRKLVHGAIGGILLSGLYNTHLLWKTSVAPYGIVYSIKVMLGPRGLLDRHFSNLVAAQMGGISGQSEKVAGR